jgi:hypothetical protein
MLVLNYSSIKFHAGKKKIRSLGCTCWASLPLGSHLRWFHVKISRGWILFLKKNLSPLFLVTKKNTIPIRQYNFILKNLVWKEKKNLRIKVCKKKINFSLVWIEVLGMNWHISLKGWSWQQTWSQGDDVMTWAVVMLRSLGNKT